MKCVIVNGQKFESGESAYYLAENILPFSTSSTQPIAGVCDHHLQNSRPVNVLYYDIHRFFPRGSSTPVLTVLARVLWPQMHPDRSVIGKPVEIWCSSLFEATNKNNFVPIENMKLQLFTSKSIVINELVLVTIPVV